MAEAFLLNMDALVTKNYLDARSAEQEARMDVSFSEVDARFTEHEARMDIRFAEQDARIGTRFAALDTRFAEIDGKFRLVMWMLAVVMASTVIPAVNQLLS